MKTKAVALYGVSVALAFLSSACQEKFLEVDPHATQVESNYYKNATEVFNGLVAAYDPMGWEGTKSYGNFACLNAASDDCYGGGGSSSDVPFLNTINAFQLDAANGPQLDFWEKGFAGVARTNTILEKLQVDVAGLTPALKKRYTAEAKFLRAYYYFDLVRLFKNVPLFTTTIPKESIYEVKQATPEAVYAQIEKDLTESIAEANLPDKVPTATEGGRVTRGMAQALLGKVYLYEKKWAEAAKQLADVNGTPGTPSKFGYQLLPKFSDIFRPDNKFSAESIIEIGHTSQAASVFGNTALVEGLVASKMFGPRSYNGLYYYAGWGGCPITPELYNLLKKDPRLEATAADVAALVKDKKATYLPGYQDTGYFIQKYAPLKTFESKGAGVSAVNYPQNYIEMRLADTYLMEAESLVQASINPTRAAALLNAVRTRVGLGATTATLDNIYAERRLELATEGHRFYDLVRTGMAAIALASSGFVAGKNEVLPIPLPELNNTKLMQNPNY